MEVETTTGVWHVRRRWAPRRLGSQTIWARFWHRTRKVRRRTTDLADVTDPGCALDALDAFVVVLLLVVVVVFLAFVGIPVLVALGEVAYVVLLAVGGVIGRVLFRRPWTVDAVGPGDDHHVWSVVGWRASGAARAFIAERVAAGSIPSQQEVAAAVLAV